MPAAVKKKSARKKKKTAIAPAQFLTPQQALFLAYYTDPRSDTFGNAKASAIKAKYSEKYADSITVKELAWLEGNVGRYERIAAKAEDNLEEILSEGIYQPAVGMFGPILELTSDCCNSDAEKIKSTTNATVTYICGKCLKPCTVSKKQVMERNTKMAAIKLDASKFALERLKKEKFGRPEHGAPVVPIQININEDRQKYA